MQVTALKHTGFFAKPSNLHIGVYNMTQIYNVLKALRELEELAAQLYEKFSEYFKEEKEVSFFFYKMHLDEISHKDLINYQLRLIQKSSKDSFKEVDIDISTIISLSERIREVLEADNILELEEAIKIAIEIESSAAEKHYRQAMKEANPDIARLLESLGTEDKVHLTRLQEFYTANKGKKG